MKEHTAVDYPYLSNECSLVVDVATDLRPVIGPTIILSGSVLSCVSPVAVNTAVTHEHEIYLLCILRYILHYTDGLIVPGR